MDWKFYMRYYTFLLQSISVSSPWISGIVLSIFWLSFATPSPFCPSHLGVPYPTCGYGGERRISFPRVNDKSSKRNLIWYIVWSDLQVIFHCWMKFTRTSWAASPSIYSMDYTSLSKKAKRGTYQCWSIFFKECNKVVFPILPFPNRTSFIACHDSLSVFFNYLNWLRVVFIWEFNISWKLNKFRGILFIVFIPMK